MYFGFTAQFIPFISWRFAENECNNLIKKDKITYEFFILIGLSAVYIEVKLAIPGMQWNDDVIVLKVSLSS